MKRLLLHSCCAPCSSAVLERLSGEYDITLFFYNPNILPQCEYDKRLDVQKRFLAETHPNVKLLIGEYHPERFKAVISGMEHLPENSERCELCYRMRLSKTAAVAKSSEFDLFATTLTLSSKKKASTINPIAAELAAEFGIPAILEDFKKKDGYNRSTALSNEYGLYRQRYCGCVLPKE